MPPLLDPIPNHDISIEQASEMTARYRNSSVFNGLNGGCFDKRAVQELLNQQDCEGLRYYYGMDGQNKPVLILVGVTSENHDMVQGKVLEMSVPCPNFCDEDSPLITG